MTLVTVVQTWGSAPRPPGALLAVRDDGVVSGSVSCSCVEDDLIARTKARFQQAAGADPALDKPAMIAYGVSQEEAARFGLPCGGSLRLGGKTVLQHTLDAVQASALPWHFEDAGHPGWASRSRRPYRPHGRPPAG